ncbi:MAG: hypothetical protein J7K54_00050 [Candidatus Aenigmarchaeota archaeon]|nr:hypothetical protein [Candidatus Aenigmarchaeota archaeon]
MLAGQGRKKGIKLGLSAHKKPSYTTEILAAVVAVAIIVVVFAIYSYNYEFVPVNKNGTANVTVETCMSRNPGVTEQACLDAEYHEKAMKENNPEICDMIQSDSLRHHCLRYFGLVR